MLQDPASPPCMFLGTRTQVGGEETDPKQHGGERTTTHTRIHFAPRLWSQGLLQESCKLRVGLAPWRPELLGSWLPPEGKHAPTPLDSKFSER